jgi:hypothetical protein
MAFTRELLEHLCAQLHQAGELAHLEVGFAVPQLLLVAPNLTVEAIVLPGGIPNAAGTVLVRRRAAAIGAVAAAYTGEAWLGFVSAPATGLARLAPEDLPRAADLPDRKEAVLTSAVWPAGPTVLHRITVITRTRGGSVLGPAQPLQARDYGTNRWLESLLTPP